MNYAKSKEKIIPVTNDTPCLLEQLKKRLDERTSYDIPFFLMPVRIETRFMKEQSSSFLDSDCLITPFILELGGRLDFLGSVVRKYGSYRAFNSEGTLAAASEMFADLEQFEKVMVLPPVNQAEKQMLDTSIQNYISQLRKTQRWLIAYCSDGHIRVDLDNKLDDIDLVTKKITSRIKGVTVDNSWKDNISEDVKNEWENLDDVLSEIEDLRNVYVLDGVLDVNKFIAILNVAYTLSSVFKVEAQNEFDKLYVWLKLQPLDEQFNKTFGDLQSLGAETELRWLYKLTTALSERWRSFALPGIPLQVLPPVRDALNTTVDEGDVSSEVLVLRKFIDTNIAEGDKIVADIMAVGAEIGLLKYDANEKTYEEGNILAGSQIEKMCVALQKYADNLERIKATLKDVNLSGETDLSYIWQGIQPLNRQIVNVNTGINVLPGGPVIDIGNPYDPGDPTGPGDPPVDPFGSDNTSTANPIRIIDVIEGHVIDIRIDITVIRDDYTVITWFPPETIIDELWIRVYPDDIAINSVETVISTVELEAGEILWTGLVHAYGERTASEAAWRTLATTYGAERAAFIKQTTTPENIEDLAEGLNNPYFKILDHINLLTDYTSKLFEFANKNKSLQFLDIDFYSGQLDFINANLSAIDVLPDDAFLRLNDAIDVSSEKFAEILALDKILLQIPAEQSLASSFKLIDSTRNRFANLSDTLSRISRVADWSEIFTATPIFGTVTTVSNSSWSEPATSKVMPDRFLFTAVNNATNDISDTDNFGAHIFKHIAIGRQIPETLKTGIDPQNPNFSYDTTNDIIFDPDLKWLVDFRSAIDKGMAKAIKMVGTEMHDGFDKILVLGLKLYEGKTHSGTWQDFLKNTGQTQLEQLFYNHQYTKGGMSFLQIGTPTNNTDDATSGFNSKNAENDLSFSTSSGAPLFTAQTPILQKSDGQRLADALGINYSAFQHIQNADKLQISNAISINRALWGGTVGNYMKEMMNFLFTDDNVHRTKDYFTDYVLARGFLPSLRIKNQPYGILPVTSFGRWDWKLKYDQNIPFPDGLKFPPPPSFTTDPPLFSPPVIGTYNVRDYAFDGTPDIPAGIGSADINNFMQDRFNLRLGGALEQLNKTWWEIAAWHTKTVEKSQSSTTAQSDFMHMLAQDATMAEAESRYFVNNAGFVSNYPTVPPRHNFTLHRLGQGGPNPAWASPPLVPGYSSIPDYFKSLFNDFQFPLNPIASAPLNHPLGDTNGLFDTTEFMDYERAMATAHSASFSPPVPRYDWITNALRIFNVKFIDSPMPYKLSGPTISEMPLSGTGFLPSPNYITWLNSPSTSLTNIWNNNAFGTMPSRSLLYLLLRQSVLLTYRDAAFDVMEGFIGSKNPIFNKIIRKVMGSPEGVMLQQSISDPYAHDPNWKKQPINKWYFLFNSIKTIADPSSLLNNSSVPAEKKLFDTFANFNAFSLGYGGLNPMAGAGNFSNDYSNVVNAYGADNAAMWPFDPLITPNIITTGNAPGLYGAFGGLSSTSPIPPAGNVFPTVWNTDVSANNWTDVILGDYLKRNPSGWYNADINALAPIQGLKDFKNALTKLSSIPTAELDHLLREHIDLCTYRLDAWSMGMVNKRLLEIRNTDNKDTAPVPAGRKTGIYLGAYGWVLNARPTPVGTTPVVANAHIPAELSTPGSVYFNQNNLGFIHTPSLTHALTAAVLRSGYKSEVSAADNRFAVNLSSERVNLAMSLLDGIRNGQTLNALLGYIFERNLHERFTSSPYAGMDSIINKLRKRLPLADPANIENNDHVTDLLDDTSTGSTVNVRAYDVVDGVALLEIFRSRLTSILNENPSKTIYDIYNSVSIGPLLTDGAGYSCMAAYNAIRTDLLLDGVSCLPAWTSSSEPSIVRPIFTEVDRIANAIDALGDVLTAEGVFQAAKGNLARSAATLEALTEGKNPVDPQVIETPINTVKISHKIGALIELFDSTISRTPSNVLPDPIGWKYINPPVNVTTPYTYNTWQYVTPSNRSIAEPNINNWIGRLLGGQLSGDDVVRYNRYPDHIACIASYINSLGATVNVQVTLTALDLQPLDILHLVRAGAFTSEMNSRICFFVRKTQNLSTNVDISINYAANGTAMGSFAQLLSMLTAIAEVISNSRWMKSSDFVNSASVAASSAPAYYLSEFAGRYSTLLSQTIALQADLTSIPLSFPDDNSMDTFRNHLFQAAYLGFEYAIPTSAIEGHANVAATNDLIGTGRKIYADLTKRIAQANAIIPSTFPSGTTEEQKIKAYANAIGTLLGNGFKAIPHFSFANYSGLQSAIYDQLQAQESAIPPTPPPNGNIMANYYDAVDDAMDDWLYSMARVKERVDNIETIRLLIRAENDEHPLEKIRPVQFPFAPTDYWMGLEYPAAYKPASDKFSVSIFNSDSFLDASTAPYYCGLIIEEWSEQIPLPEQTTGITFNYGQPVAKPPQNVLLAINPKTIQTNSIDDTATSKKWDIEDLLYTLLDTIDMAQIRMVEPDDFVKVSGASASAASPYNAGNPPSDDELKSTGKFDIFKWILPAIVGEVTPKDASGNYQGAGSVQTVSFDYYANSANPPVAPPMGTGTTGTGSAGESTSAPIGVSVPGTTYSGPVIADWGVLHDADSAVMGGAFGIPAVGGLESSEYIVGNAEAQEFIERQSILSGITALQSKLSGLIESTQQKQQ